VGRLATNQNNKIEIMTETTSTQTHSEIGNHQRSRQVHYRACHLCEAICGLEIVTETDRIISIKGDEKDPFSRGHICPKAIALKDIQEDPDRLKKPVKRVGDEWVEVTWDEALKGVAQRLFEVQNTHGDDSVGVYAGNPNVHNYGNLTHGRLLRKALGTRNNFSATSLDQLPHQLLGLKLYGHQFLLPVPDIDHTDYMLILGANPLASNGSMMTVPDVKKRLKAIQKRGGKVVVVDPRRSETAEIADAHHFIRPGTDALLLMAILFCLFDEDRVDAGHLSSLLDGVETIEAAVAPFSPETVGPVTGIDSETIRQMARDMAESDRAVCYGRMGVSVQQFGTLCQWAIQLINLLTGNVDKVGGALVPSPAVGYVKPGEPTGGHFARFKSRVSGLPEFGGEFPSAVLAEEILTPGDGQIRAMVTLAGNPVLSAPNGRRLDEAFSELDFMVALDFYINETTRHADYILPPTSPLEHDHYDIAFLRLAVRDTTRFNEAIIAPEESALHDWQILSGIAQALGELKDKPVKPLPAPHMLMDFALQSGPYGKHAGSELELSLAKLKEHPHGIDIGPLKPSLTERLCTENGRIRLDHALFIDDLARLQQEINQPPESGHELRLIGRRHVRSNNSWMHNFHRLVKGKPRWQCFMNPKDMQARGLTDGQDVSIESRVGAVKTVVVASDEMMPGVISLPHGWGHQRDGVRQAIATEQAGVSVNDITDDQFMDPLTGNAALNGVPVRVVAA